jgi:hypothetical protein
VLVSSVLPLTAAMSDRSSTRFCKIERSLLALLCPDALSHLVASNGTSVIAAALARFWQ